MKTSDSIEFIVFIVIFLIAGIANLAKFLKKNKGKPIDWETILTGNKKGTPSTQNEDFEFLEPGVDETEDYFQENEAENAEPSQQEKPWITLKPTAPAIEETEEPGLAGYPGGYVEFIRNNGASAIVMHEILGKPKALQD
jgi:hypothetical protein